MASLANKVGIVTGGGTGIGRATALAMAKAGASLVIGNREAKRGEEVVWAIEQDIEMSSFLFDVNIKGVFCCMKYQIQEMHRTGGGSIVNTSSIFGLNGYPGWSLYSATKHAVTGMTKSAAPDYAKRGIRVNAVGPGPVETPLLAKGTGGDPHSYASFVPMGRIGQPEEIADPVIWLLSDEAQYVTGHKFPGRWGRLRAMR
jgi:NAD(P)-dependent dehydrogenase (short-subunit alcohol dehydrogenase family)